MASSAAPAVSAVRTPEAPTAAPTTAAASPPLDGISPQLCSAVASSQPLRTSWEHTPERHAPDQEQKGFVYKMTCAARDLVLAAPGARRLSQTQLWRATAPYAESVVAPRLTSVIDTIDSRLIGVSHVIAHPREAVTENVTGIVTYFVPSNSAETVKAGIATVTSGQISLDSVLEMSQSYANSWFPCEQQSSEAVAPDETATTERSRSEKLFALQQQVRGGVARYGSAHITRIRYALIDVVSRRTASVRSYLCYVTDGIREGQLFGIETLPDFGKVRQALRGAIPTFDHLQQFAVYFHAEVFKMYEGISDQRKQQLTSLYMKVIQTSRFLVGDRAFDGVANYVNESKITMWVRELLGADRPSRAIEAVPPTESQPGNSATANPNTSTSSAVTNVAGGGSAVRTSTSASTAATSASSPATPPTVSGAAEAKVAAVREPLSSAAATSKMSEISASMAESRKGGAASGGRRGSGSKTVSAN